MSRTGDPGLVRSLVCVDVFSSNPPLYPLTSKREQYVRLAPKRVISSLRAANTS